MNAHLVEGGPLYSPLAEDSDLAELVEEFVNEVPQRIASLEHSLRLKNWADVGRFAHQMKGAAGSYGFSDVTPFAKRVEDQAKAAAPEAEITAAVNDLSAVCARLRAGVPQQVSHVSETDPRAASDRG